MTKDLVSILIPVYNAEKWLAATIQSALDQTWENIEIIIVDDGSIDQSLEIAQSFISQKVKVITQKNAGASAARNRAFDTSKGAYIQYLDADDLLAPDKIEKQMNRISQESTSTVASGPFHYFKNNIETPISKTDHAYHDYVQPIDWLIEAACKQDMFPPLVWLTPRELIERAGHWNKDLSYNDDPEFFARVLLNADKIAFCKEAKSYYRRGIDSSLGSRKDKQALASQLASLELVTEHLQKKEDSQRVREACGYALGRYIYSLYPKYPHLRKRAQVTLNELGVKPEYNFSNNTSAKLEKMLGWRTAKWLKHFYKKQDCAS